MKIKQKEKSHSKVARPNFSEATRQTDSMDVFGITEPSQHKDMKTRNESTVGKLLQSNKKMSSNTMVVLFHGIKHFNAYYPTQKRPFINIAAQKNFYYR